MIKLPPKGWEGEFTADIPTGGEALVEVQAMPIYKQQNTWIIKVLEQIVEHLNDIERAPFKDVHWKEMEMDEAFTTKDLNV